jgi:MFS family permease
MKAWVVTSITNFVAAGEAFLAAGFLLGRVPLSASAACFWALALLFLALGLLIGGIDHGFFEQKGDSRSRMIMQKATWICVGLTTFFTLLTALYRFAPAGWRASIIILGLVQFLIFCFFAIRIHKYLVVIINYAPVLLILLVLNIIGLSSGAGSGWFIGGILISILASAFQALGVDRFTPLDRNGLYHVVLMGAVAILFIGGLGL